MPPAPSNGSQESAVETWGFKTGDVIAGKYVVEHVVGVGGVSVVLAARHLELDEMVALKFLRPEARKNPDLVERFSREGKSAVRIKTEYAARIYDVGVTKENGPFVVEEYLEGKDLGVVVRESGPMAVRRAAELTMQACEALAFAHTHGIVHRDIKPENLFLTRRPDGTELVKVLDFGISRATLEKAKSATAYRPPEQVRSSGSVDARSDVWSLGAVLFKLVTSKSPFDGQSNAEISARVLDGELPPLATLVSNPPEGLEAVIKKCLEKDPAKRFQNVAELAVALVPYAPEPARVCAARTSGILRAAGQSVPPPPRAESLPPPNSNRGVPSSPSIARPVASAPSAPPTETRKTGRVIVASCVALLAALGIAAAVVLPPSRAPRPTTTAAPATPAPLASHTIEVDSDPQGARVEWQGQVLGETPTEVQLPVGAHTLHISLEHYAVEDLVLTVSGGESDTHRTHVALRHLPDTASSVADLQPTRGRPPKPGAPRGAPSGSASARVATRLGVPPPSASAPPPPASVVAAAQTPAVPAAPSAKPKVRLIDDSQRVRLFDDSKP